ncbi:MAG: hypothetical protein HDR80_07690 [Bacteroides sp.]|nr:hypothetical protein [Bacteroides sp.]
MKNSLLYLMLPLAALTAGGCADSNEPSAGAPDRERLLITLNLTVDAPAPTRAGEVYSGTWGDDYTPAENGSTFDCAIKDIYPVLYRVGANGAASSAVARMARTSSSLVKSSDGKAVYRIDGVLEPVAGQISDDALNVDYLTSHDFRIAVFANHNPGATALTLMNPGSFTAYGTPGQTIGSGDNATTFSGIPMWGVADVDFDGIRLGTSFMMGDIPLLRAMAQVRLTVSDEMWEEREVRLQSLSINRLQPTGLILPRLDWTSIASISTLGVTDTPNAFSSAGALGEVTGYTVSAGTDASLRKTLTFYLPETENSTTPAAADELVLTATYTVDGDDTPRTGSIYFRPYSETGVASAANQYHIIRNHIYEYTIIGVAASYTPEIQLSVRKWTYEERHTEL